MQFYCNCEAFALESQPNLGHVFYAYSLRKYLTTNFFRQAIQ